MTLAKWFIYTVIGIVVITAYWLWPIYLLIAMFAVFGTNSGSRSRVQRVRPYKFKKQKMPVYRPVRHKRTKPYRSPKTRRKWGKPVKIDKVWKL